MTPDHYAILGVPPTAPQAVIRAAYLALMREYHPDRNPTRSATERAQAIIAAYKVLGDFDRRQQYDWGLRREREAAAALTQAPQPRRIPQGAIAAGTVGLAAIAALLLWPAPEVDRVPDNPPRATVAKAKAAPARKGRALEVKAKAASPARLKPEVEAVRVARVEEGKTKPAARVVIAEEKAIPKAGRSVPKARVLAAAVVPATIEPRSKPAKPVAPAKPGIDGDLASLDQFVMSFYGQSWRFGDLKRRAALQQSRDDFVVRRGACAADSCKRAAYLKLMRDVSVIVESGAAPR